MSTTTEHDLAGILEGHLDEVVLTDGDAVATLSGALPYAVDGLHWKVATHRIFTAARFDGEEARGIVDGETRHRGRVKHVTMRSSGDMAVLVVEPPTELAQYAPTKGEMTTTT